MKVWAPLFSIIFASLLASGCKTTESETSSVEVEAEYHSGEVVYYYMLSLNKGEDDEALCFFASKTQLEDPFKYYLSESITESYGVLYLPVKAVIAREKAKTPDSQEKYDGLEKAIEKVRAEKVVKYKSDEKNRANEEGDEYNLRAVGRLIRILPIENKDLSYDCIPKEYVKPRQYN